MTCAPVVITPRAIADASGKIKLWLDPEENIIKSVPEAPVERV